MREMKEQGEQEENLQQVFPLIPNSQFPIPNPKSKIQNVLWLLLFPLTL